jgi:hypothetical protein
VKAVVVEEVVARPWSDAEEAAVRHLFRASLSSQSSNCPSYLRSLDWKVVFDCHWEGETSWGVPEVGNLVIEAKPSYLDGVDCFALPCQWYGRD